MPNKKREEIEKEKGRPYLTEKTLYFSLNGIPLKLSVESKMDWLDLYEYFAGNTDAFLAEFNQMLLPISRLSKLEDEDYRPQLSDRSRAEFHFKRIMCVQAALIYTILDHWRSVIDRKRNLFLEQEQIQKKWPKYLKELEIQKDKILDPVAATAECIKQVYKREIGKYNFSYLFSDTYVFSNRCIKEGEKFLEIKNIKRDLASKRIKKGEQNLEIKKIKCDLASLVSHVHWEKRHMVWYEGNPVLLTQKDLEERERDIVETPNILDFVSLVNFACHPDDPITKTLDKDTIESLQDILKKKYPLIFI
jgi:hypothetical protein